MGDDEQATVQSLTEYRNVFKDHIDRHKGMVVDTAGDSVLATFDSPVEAVECAVEIQRELARRNRNLADHRRMNFRIGINLGDVILREDNTVYGDGVNIAARLESLGAPGGIIVPGTVFDHVENKLPVSFEFAGEQSVKNIDKPVRAYRVGDGSTARVQAASAASPKAEKPRRTVWTVVAGFALVIAVAVGGWQAARSPAHIAKGDPVVAVLAFTNMSGDPKQEYFSDGLTENIIDSLAQLSDLRVIARNSTFRYKGQAADVRKIGGDLGATHVVEGSVQRASDTVRVTVQLVETASGSHLWSKTFDRALTAQNMFAIQDEIAGGIATTLAGTFGVLRQQGLALAKHKAPNALSSYECVLLGIERERALSLQAHRAVRDCAEQSVKVDPDYANLWDALAKVYMDEYQFGYDPRPGSLDRALAAVRRAIELAPTDLSIRQRLANIQFFRGELDEFKANSNQVAQDVHASPDALAFAGTYFAYAGEWDRGVALVERAKALDPFFPPWYHFASYYDHYRKGEYEAALAVAQQINLPDYVWYQAMVAAAYGQLGRSGAAEPYVKRILELNPNFESTARENRWKWFRYQEPLLDKFMDGLRKAGMKIPEKKS